MKTHEFIAKYGIEKSKHILDTAPKVDCPLYYNVSNSLYLYTGYENRYYVDGEWILLNIERIDAVPLNHLQEVLNAVQKVDKCITDIKQLMFSKDTTFDCVKNWLLDCDELLLTPEGCNIRQLIINDYNVVESYRNKNKRI